MASKQNQMNKLLSIAEGRTRRAARTVEAAQTELKKRLDALDEAEAALLAAEQELRDAKAHVISNPGCDQTRLWQQHQTQRKAEQEENKEEAESESEAAQTALNVQMQLYQRQQLRQDHMESHAAKIKREDIRTKERRQEDDVTLLGQPSPLDNG